MARNAPFISGLLRTRTMYAPGTPVRIAVTLVNPRKEAFHGKLLAADLFGLEGRRTVADAAVALAPGGKSVVDLDWCEATGPEAGHEMQFALLDQDGKELDRDRIDVGITTDGRFLHLPAIDFGSGKSSGHPFDVFYVYPESHTERMNVVAARTPRPRQPQRPDGMFRLELGRSGRLHPAGGPVHARLG